MRDYGKVHTSFWASSNVRAMSEDGRTLAMYLLTCPHGTIAGVFRLPDGYASEDLQWDAKRVKQGFVELLANGFANRCETTKWVWVRKHLEWNPPENPNQRKSAAKVATQVPDECDWKADFMRICGESIGLRPLDYSNGCGTLSKGFANQEQEQEQKNIDEAVASSAGTADADHDGGEGASGDDGKAGSLPCPHQQIIALYAKHLPMLTQPRVWEGARSEALKTRWRKLAKPNGVTKGYTTLEEGLAFWGRFFAYVAKSRKLTDGIPRGDGSAWQPDLPWLLKAENFAKVIEGKYHDEVSA